MRIALIVISLFLGNFLQAQNAKFYATADSKKILSDSYISVTFTLENGEGSNFKAPAFKNFTVARGPSSSTNMQIINGKVSQSMSYGYDLTPNKIGKLFIEPASIIVNGKTVQSNPLQIEVVKKKVDPNATNQEPVYVRIEASDSIAHIGQQIIIDYKLYTKLDVRGTSYLDKPEYNGFFAEDVRMSRTSFKREIINGDEYYVKVIDRVALFPQQTGSYTLEPIRFNLRTPTGKTSGFFNTTRLRNFTAKSNGLQIQVKDLKEPIPSSFSGAVGSYTMKARSDRNTITADDAFVLRMDISGDGDSRTIQAPEFKLADGLEMYDPNILKDENRSNGNRIINNKVFEYIIVPKEQGRYRIEPEFSFFDVDSNAFVTIRGTPQTLTVAPSVGGSKIRRDEKISKVELAAISSSSNIYKNKKPFFGSIYYWSIFSLCGMASLAILWMKRKQLIEDGIDPLERKANEAASIASQRLTKADAFIAESKYKDAFAEISNSLKEYLSDKWHVAYSELNSDKIQALLRERNFDEQIIDDTAESLSACEMAIYAGVSQEKVHQVRNQIGTLIESIEKSS